MPGVALVEAAFTGNAPAAFVTAAFAGNVPGAAFVTAAFSLGTRGRGWCKPQAALASRSGGGGAAGRWAAVAPPFVRPSHSLYVRAA